MDSNSADSFPERRLDGKDSYENNLDYLIQRSAQLLKHRQDEDLFQQKEDGLPLSSSAHDDSSGSDSSSQAECGSRGSLSQESDPELETVLATYYAPPRTVASLVTLPSLNKAISLSSHGSWPTIPSESSQSMSLRSLQSLEDTHKMIWQLEEIAAELKAIDNNSVPNLTRVQASVSSPLPAPLPLPNIPLPPLPSTPSPISEAKLVPPQWSARTLSPGESRASSLSGASLAHSLAYLRADSTASVFRQGQLLLSAKEMGIPRIIVTEPSSENLQAGEVVVKDATLLMDLVEDCYGDHWDPDRTLLYRTQTTMLTAPDPDSYPMTSFPRRPPSPPPKAMRRREYLDDGGHDQVGRTPIHPFRHPC